MISVRRLSVVALVATLLLGTAVAAVALRANPPRDPQPVQSAHRYWASGPSATYGSDYGALGVVRPLRVAVPEGTYDAVVTVSFDYRTHGPGPFLADLDLPRVATRPDSHPLPAADGAPATVRFLVEDLAGGRTYDFAPVVNSTTRPFGGNRITTRRVLVTVDLTPAG